MAAEGRVGLFEAVASAAAHGFEELGAVGAEEGVLWGVGRGSGGWLVELAGRDAAVLVAFEMGEVTVLKGQ